MGEQNLFWHLLKMPSSQQFAWPESDGILTAVRAVTDHILAHVPVSTIFWEEDGDNIDVILDWSYKVVFWIRRSAKDEGTMECIHYRSLGRE